MIFVTGVYEVNNSRPTMLSEEGLFRNALRFVSETFGVEMLYSPPDSINKMKNFLFFPAGRMLE